MKAYENICWFTYLSACSVAQNCFWWFVMGNHGKLEVISLEGTCPRTRLLGAHPVMGCGFVKNRSCWCNSQKKNRFAWVKLRTLSLYVFRPSCFYESTLICFKVSLKSGSWPSFGVSWHWLLLSSDFASLASPHCWGLDIEYVEYVDIYANVTCPLGVVISNHVVRWWCWVS